MSREPGELRADHVLALRIAIEQQPVRPDDVIARQAAGMWSGAMECAHRTITELAAARSERGRV